MQILFIHQNFPGQFRHLAPALAGMGHDVVAMAIRPAAEVQVWRGVRVVPYQVRGGNTPGLHPWLVDMETKTLRAEACWLAARQLTQQAFAPELIVAHPAWGEPLFLKQVWPAARLVLYAEMFYLPNGADAGFDPEFLPADAHAEACRLQMKNLNHLAHLDQADALLSPTQWQANTFPPSWRERIRVIHDGIDTDELCPAPHARFQLTSGDPLTRDDEVITYVARNLEPYRGFHVFMRSLPELLRKRPKARVVVVGSDQTGYGAAAPRGKTWRQVFVDEVRAQIPDAAWRRVHFVGRLSRENFTGLLQVSSVHVYLSYPFVLSWSLLEAMSVGCCIVASDTAPVREAITDGEQGRLVDFFDRPSLVSRIVELLDAPGERDRLGRQARQRAIERYDLKKVCLPQQLGWLNGLAAAPEPRQASTGSARTESGQRPTANAHTTGAA